MRRYRIICVVLFSSLGSLGQSEARQEGGQRRARADQRWATFERGDAAIVSSAPIIDADHEVDVIVGDLDRDGDDDVVVVRKEPFIAPGGRSNVLLMNEDGRLVDRTADLASASSLPSDRGFLTPTNDRDVQLADFDGDGWLDVVTAVDFSPGQPKHLSHPRIYRNLGRKDGVWLGLRHEDERFPELKHLDSGAPVLPRFTSVAVGDLDGDGDVDLYFGDHDIVLDAAGEPGTETPEDDSDDRMLFNDGKGFFTDASATNTAGDVRKSAFCNSVAIVDVNGDGLNDVLKQTSYERPAVCYVAYNDAENKGHFTARSVIYEGRPYFVTPGDLNGDGRLDVVLSENGLDRHLYNLPLEGGGVRWSEPMAFEFLFGEDDKYAGNSVIKDLDGDGWQDVIITDVDPEIADYSRRTHIYHNRGGTTGGDDIVLREERERKSEGGWIGVVGIKADDLIGVHDVAVLDLDGDGKQDIVFFRLAGTDVWFQRG